MKNLYFNSIVKKSAYSIVLLGILLGFNNTASAQVRKTFTQRTSQYSPTKKIYNVKGDFAMLGNTCLTPQNYSATTNNNGQFMTYVDTDGDSSTFNSSSSTLVLSTENGSVPECSNIVYAGLYWTGKSSPNATFDVTKSVATGTQSINNNLNIVHGQSIANTSYSLVITRGGSNNNRYPIYTFTSGSTTYAFRFYNSGATNRATLSINGGTETNIPVTVNGASTEATLNTPYTITNGTVTLTIKKLIRDAGTNLSSNDTQNLSNADVNVSGTITTYSNVTKTFNKRIVKLKGPASASYTTITAAATDIYYPSGSEDDIYSGYAEITDYVRTNGLGQYTVADMALLEGDPGGTGYSGGWGMIVVYENSKMKWRDVTIFDGYAYVASTNTSGFDLPVSGFNTVQSGNVGVKLGVMASEGDVNFTGDYFRIQNLASANYTSLSHSGNSATNFFNSSINTGGTRDPNLVNNTGIDIAVINIPNTGNAIIGNSQTATNFKYGTTSDTYSIFAITMSVDAYVPEVEAVVSTTTINNAPAVLPYTILPGQDAGYTVDIKNIGTEAVNNYKIIVPIPYNATYVAGSAIGTIFSPQTTPTPNSITFNPSLGATGSIVWDFGTLVLPVSPNGPTTLLARLTFKLRATTDCGILNNATCGSVIAVNGNSTGVGNTTNVTLNNSNFIQGYTQNGSCSGVAIPAPINIGINGASYVEQNCPSTDYTRHFSYCSASTSVGTSEIASNFPLGSLFYNTFPVTISSVQYTDANPIPLVAGSTVTYYAVPPGGGTGCNFPFTITKCPVIIAQDDTLAGGNGTTANPNVGNVLNNNGNGNDTLNGSNALITQVNITVTTPATSIGGAPVPSIDPATGQVSVPAGTPAGTYTIVYNLCEKVNPITNCDSATVSIIVTAPAILAVANNFSIQCSTPGALGNVIANDLLNGVSFSSSLVNITLISGANANISLDLTTGDISIIGSGLSVGQYTLVYRICEKLNPTNCSQANIVINVVDTVAPTWTTATASLNTTVECSNAIGLAAAQALFPVATDACDTNVNNIVKTSGTFVPGTCGTTGTYTNTWTVTDDSGNTSVVYTQTITVVDTVAPTWTTAAAALNATVQCSDAAGLAAAQALAPTATDNCAGTVTYTKTSGAFVAGTCGATGTYTNTWVAQDACLNSSTTFTQTISIVDTVAPTWTTAASALNTTLECNDTAGLAAAQALAPTATDNCAGTVTYTKTSGAFVAGTCGATGTYTNTWVAQDACLNSSTTFTQTITVVDTVAPTWTTAANALNATVQCSDAAGLATAQALTPTATDNCAGTVTYTKTSGVFVAGTCGATGTYTNTWVAQDSCLNSSTTFTQTISIVDTVAPTWTTAASALNTTLECNDTAGLAAAQALAPTATDNCAGTVTYTKTSGAFVAGTCGATGTYTNTWVAQDACLNSSTTFTQTISIVDTVAPTWTTAASALNTTLECNDTAGLAAAQALAPTATDNCAGTVTYTKTSGAFVAGTCGATGTYTNTWVAQDACLNSSTTFTQTITVVDTVAPTWTTAANALNATVQCSDAAGLATAQALTPTATDNCAGTVTYTKTSGVFVAGTCGATGTYTNTWVAQDSCLNSSTTFTQTISIVDTVAPTWTTAASALNTTLECNDTAGLAAAQALAPTATDNCAGTVTYTKTSGAFVAGTCGATGTYTNTWVAQDACLNSSTTFTQTISIVDTVAPTWTTATSALNTTLECNDTAGLAAAQALAPTATDNCDGTVTYTKTSGAFVAGTCGATGTYTNTWVAQDSCLNSSTIFTQTITVVDTIAPTWTTAATALNTTVQCSDAAGLVAAQALAPTATDNCDGTVTYTKTSGAFVAGSCGATGTYTNTWVATDSCLNTSTTFTQTVTIIDTTSPEITTAAANATVECDGQGNTAALNAWLASNGGASASDTCSNVTWSNNFIALSDDCGNTGTASVTFTATDDCGNATTTSATFTIEDTTAPTIDTAAANATVQCDGQGNTAALTAWLASNGGAAASDACSNVTWTNNFDGLSDGCGNTGTASVTFTATDDCGNATTTSATFTIEDTTAPTIDTAAANATVQCDGQGNTAALTAWLASNGGAAASDACSNVTWTNNFDGLSDGCGNTGTASVTFTATDDCGNTSTTSATFTIEDTTAPTIDTAAANATVQCDGQGNTAALTAWLASNGGATASDACSNVTWTNNYTELSDGCGNTGTASVTFTATDDCGNTSTTSATFTIEDTTAPTIDTAAANATVQCDGQGNTAALTAWLASNGGAAASDACSNVTWTNNYTELSDGCGNTGSASVTFTATDDCGNATTTSATFTIEDTTAPTIDTAAANATVQCDGQGNTAALTAWLASNGGAAASDACSNVTWTNNFDGLSDGCGNTGTASVTFTATDDCGNTSTTSATFTIEDTTAPTIDTAAANATVQCDGQGNTAALQAWLASNGGATASDACSNVTWTNNYTELSDGCGNTGTASVTFTATDDCGNTSTTSATFTIEDTTAPTIDTAAANITVQCNGAGNTGALQSWLSSNGGASASDSCSNVTWTNNFDSLSNDCSVAVTIIFTATDDCGNVSTTSATFTVEDTTAPTIDTAADNATVECDGQGNTAALTAWLASNGGAVASDTCTNVTWSNNFDGLSDGCGNTGAATVTFTATDACGNATTTSATFTIEDTTAPTIDTAAANATVQCDGQGNTAALTAWLASNGGATASDACSNVTWTNNYTELSDGCGNTGTASVTFTATDDCGNTSTTSATFTIEDTTAPTIDTAAANATVQCDGQGNTEALTAWLASNGGAAASDACSNVTWTNNFDGLSDGCGNTGTASVTFTATDDCGNTSTTSATFTIEDTTAPTIDTAAANATVQCDGQGNTATLTAWLASNGGAAASDACSNVTWTNNFDGLSDGCGNTGTASVTFTATDDCGNTSTTSATFTIEDTTAPTIDTAAANATVQCDGQGNTAALTAWLASNGGGAASDACSNVTWTNNFDGLSDGCGNTGTASVTFTATDDCGNTSTTSATFTIEDTTAPTIDTAAANATVQCDGQGNTAALTAWLASNGGAAASDACSNVTWTNNFDGLSDGCGNTGTASVTFTATDDCGNTSTTSATFTIEDTTAPTIDTVAANATVQCDGQGNTAALTAWLASNGGAAASDACSNVTWTNNYTELSDGCGNTGTASVTFTATDDCGNTSTTSATFTIEDTTAPTIDTAATNATVQCDGQGNTAALTAWLASNGGAAASDACSNVTWTNNYTELSDGCGNTGSASVTFTATDDCGNTSTTSATFTIEDTTAPNIDTAAANATVQCDGQGNTAALQAWLASNGGATASDACSNVTWTNNYTELSDGCGNTGAASVTFTATDDCGNTSTTSATFTIEDTTAPTIDTAATNATVQCDGQGNTAALTAWLASNGGAAASDACSNVTWTNNYTELSDGCGNTGTASVTFTATDDCGNTSTTSAIFTIEDTTAPTISVTTVNVTVECDGNGNAEALAAWLASNGGASASDICSNVTWTNNFEALSDGCGNSGSASVTFTATDDCGNAASATGTFTIVDTIAPTLTTAAANATVECDGQGNTAALNAWLASNGGASASDTCSNVTWSNNFIALSDDCGSTGSATVIFTATDGCGNSVTSTAIFTIQDTLAPTTSTEFDQKIQVTCATIPDAPVLVFNDNCSGNVVPVLTETQTAIVDNVYTITRTWIATDACGNISLPSRQTIYVSVTTTTVLEIPVQRCNLAEFDSVDLMTLLPDGTPTTGTWTNVNSVGGLTGNVFNAFQIPLGDYIFRYTLANSSCFESYDILMNVNDDCRPLACVDIVIHNAFTPNGDEFNQFFNIEHIDEFDCYPSNNVQIYNRWGVLVYETKNYDNLARRFEGISEGRTTVNKSSELPTGTYFYIIQYTTTDGQTVNKDGYLYLTR